MPLSKNTKGPNVFNSPLNSSCIDFTENNGWSKQYKFGRNESIGSNSNVSVWENNSIASFPTSAAPLSVVSSSVNDTSGGTGARTLFVDGLDALGLRQTEVITLNGTTPVLTTLDFLRVNSSYIISAGTGDVNEGSLTGTIGGILTFTILATFGRTTKGIFSTPSNSIVSHPGKLAISYGGAAARITVILYSRGTFSNRCSNVLYTGEIDGDASSNLNVDLYESFVLDSGSDYEFRAVGNSGNGSGPLSITFTYILKTTN